MDPASSLSWRLISSLAKDDEDEIFGGSASSGITNGYFEKGLLSSFPVLEVKRQIALQRNLPIVMQKLVLQGGTSMIDHSTILRNPQPG